MLIVVDWSKYDGLFMVQVKDFLEVSLFIMDNEEEISVI